MESADIEMMFSVLPVARRYTMDASRAIGMESTMMKVALQRPRNANTTSITTRKVIRMVSLRELMVFRMFLELSTTTVIFTSEGRVFSILFISFLIFLITSTVLAPDCFCITIPAPWTPLQ